MKTHKKPRYKSYLIPGETRNTRESNSPWYWICASHLQKLIKSPSTPSSSSSPPFLLQSFLPSFEIFVHFSDVSLLLPSQQLKAFSMHSGCNLGYGEKSSLVIDSCHGGNDSGHGDNYGCGGGNDSGRGDGNDFYRGDRSYDVWYNGNDSDRSYCGYETTILVCETQKPT